MTKILVTLLLALSLVACEPASPPAPTEPASQISAVELNDRLAANAAPLILDVRSQGEYAAGHIPGALLIVHQEFIDAPAATLALLPSDKNAEIVIHCQSGKRAGIASEVMQQAGFSNVRHLQGDWQGWQAGGYPIEQ